MKNPRHVYANPVCPEICPILRSAKNDIECLNLSYSLAVLLFSRAPQLVGSSLLFGEKAQTRFTDWLSATCKKNESDIFSMGLLITDIGSHSFRKGVATTVSNTPGGPSPFSVWLRAGWSLGNVQSRYIFEEPGGDQFIGRAAAGI